MTTTKPGRAARIRAVLDREFSPAELEIEDESARHAGHAGAAAGGETHYKVTLVSPRFHGLSRVECSRMVHQALAAELQTGLHALSLSLRSPSNSKSYKTHAPPGNLLSFGYEAGVRSRPFSSRWSTSWVAVV